MMSFINFTEINFSHLKNYVFFVVDGIKGGSGNCFGKEMEYADLMHPSMRLHERLHGESFLAIAGKHFRQQGIYILDEPEAALSPQR